MTPRLALLALVALLVPACRKAEETRFLNFDPETTADRLVSGWSGWEKTGEDDTFVWATAREARVKVQSRGDGDRLVRFRAWPFLFLESPGQSVTLFVNGEKVGNFDLAKETRVYTALAPKAAWKAGTNELKFAFAYAESPKSRIRGAEDARTLAAGFDWIEIVPPLATPKR